METELTLPAADLPPHQSVFKTGIDLSPSNGLIAAGRIGGHECQITIDTGSNVSIIRPDILERLTNTQPVQPVESSLRTVTGATAPIQGRGKLPISMGTYDVVHDFWIAEITDECILGLDFMVEHDCRVDLKDGILHIKEEEIPLLRPGELWPPTCCRVVSGSCVTVPPNSELLVPGTVVDVSGDFRWGLVEPTQQCLVADLAVGKTLVELRHPTVPVRVLNLSEGPRTIAKGITVASCVPVETVRHLHSPPSSSLPGESRTGLPPHLESLYARSATHLSSEQGEMLRHFLAEYADLFSNGPGDLGRTDLVKHHIDTGDSQPIRQPPRRLPLEKNKEAIQVVETLQEQGLIEPSDSPWASPVVLVRKKNGNWRFCVDYRKLNDVTRKDAYPLPRIEDTLETLADMSLFSTLDLRSGYWQVELNPADKPKTAFAVERGLWQFRVMPFGLCNAPATFERLMDRVLAGLPLTTALVYIDDILVPARSFEQGIENLRNVFDRLRAAKLKLAPEKCWLFREEVAYLGHTISRTGISTDPSKIEAVRSWPRPTNMMELRSFVGLCSYYRRFVPHFADIARPLYHVTTQKLFSWSTEAEAAFLTLKQALTSAPILGYPRPEGQLILDTDASNFAVGAVLSQVQDSEERVLAYYSQVLNQQERNYCVTRRELLAVVKAVSHFHHYLYGHHFHTRTDHAALRWLFSFRHPEGQLARWLERLQEYDFTIQYRPGIAHTNADAMSRRPCVHNPCKGCDRVESKENLARQQNEIVAIQYRTADHASELVSRVTQVDSESSDTGQTPKPTPSPPEWGCEDLRRAQIEDPDLQPILTWMRSGKARPMWSEVSPYSQSTKTYWSQWDSLQLRDGVLYRCLENVVILCPGSCLSLGP